MPTGTMTGSLTTSGANTGVTIRSIDEIAVPSGTVIRTSQDQKEIGPRLYFDFVKTKFKKTEIEKIEQSIGPLTQLISNAKEVGQEGLYEELLIKLAVMLRVQEALAVNVCKYVLKEDISKFINIVRGRTIELRKLESYPRPIPSNIRSRITLVKSRNIFDEYWVLYNNPTKEVVKTNKEKIIEKDPILFGVFVNDPDKYYHIVSWEDEYCDLTLDKFVDTLKNDKVTKEYTCGKIPKLTNKDIDQIKQEVFEKYNRLKSTKPSNYKQLAEEESKVSIFSKVRKLFSKFSK